MKIRMILIGLILLWINSGFAEAATLSGTRAGDHDDFTRIVFEFENIAQFTEPAIGRDGTLSVVFPNTTTTLLSPIIYGTTTRVEEIQLYQRDSTLAANITLAIPHFKVKSYLLSNPDRYVIDIFSIPPPPIEKIPAPKVVSIEKTGEIDRAIEQSDEINSPSEETDEINSPTEETDEVEGAIEKGDEVESHIEKTADVEHPVPGIKNIRGIVKGSAIQPIDKASIFSSSYGFLQTFFLAGLNLFTLVIIVLLSLILSRQIRVIDSAHIEYVPEQRREPENPITAIDKKIRQRLNGMVNQEVWR
jgi:hypothetical protein